MAPLNQLDPQTAWSPYEPGKDGPWNRALAAHLYRRAGFGATSKQLDEAVASTPAEVSRKLANAVEPAEFTSQVKSLSRTVLAGGESRSLGAWWLYRFLETPRQLAEKMVLFWHGHFATSADKVTDIKMLLAQNELFRRHALGDFTALVQGVSRDPAMLIYLDSITNRKAHPNENYARELMELFCLGEGNYTEKDIQEIARCFTGWEIKRGKYRFNRFQHDSGEKSFLGGKGKFGGEDAVRLVLQQPAGARFIARKLVRYFVMDEPSPSDALIEPLAEQLRADQWNVRGTIERILSSKLFFGEHAVARKVRSPVELTVGLLRCLEGSSSVYTLADECDDLGQGLFRPPNVKGWDGGRAWINSSTLIGRANTVRRILSSEKTRFARGDLGSLLDKHHLTKPRDVVVWFKDLLLAAPIPPEVESRLVEIASKGKSDRGDRAARVLYMMATLPEFQLG